MVELWNWLEENLFTHNYFDSKYFPHELMLYSHAPRLQISEHFEQMETQFSRENLYRAVMKTCSTHKRNRNALWFHVNVVDQAVWILEDYQRYAYPLPPREKPLARLFQRMEEHPADQGGTTYVGLLSDDKKWLLLLERCGQPMITRGEQADFKISFYGSQELCKTVRSFLKQKAS